ncbi:hypothetical protein [Thalassobellus suaedae]|uniref:Uncharacterized protein n=1 Tax=Thalassobellus suaedae TaxID=3074124 RepID=A0ABY9XRN9_9FLAO|nr:hypothetical protein RHP51_16115 [Flavobacteriaceae bacterium HL-DH14]
MESNLTKLVLIGIFLYYFSIWVYKRINILGIVLVLIAFYAAITFLSMTSEAIQNEIYHFQSQFTVEQSYKAVENSYAKRPQVVLYQLNYEKFKWIGNGPYDYYNIIEGKFRKTIHFSQLIWFYNDLGIIGLLIMLFASWFIINNLGLNNQSKILLSGVFLFYLFMTNILGDMSMMLVLLIINNKIK